MSIPRETEFDSIIRSQEELSRNQRYTELRRRAEKKQEQLELKRRFGFNEEDWYWED